MQLTGLLADGVAGLEAVRRCGGLIVVQDLEDADACSDCGGPVWQHGTAETATFRCHVGHALSTRVPLDAQGEQIERSPWVVVRNLSEHAVTLRRLADSSDERRSRLGESCRERANEAIDHSDRLRLFLLSLHGRLAVVS